MRRLTLALLFLLILPSALGADVSPHVPSIYGNVDSVQNGGSLANPAAGAVIATITPGAGVWLIWCWTRATNGGVAASVSGNMQLQHNAVVLLSNLPSEIAAGGAFGHPAVAFGPIRRTLVALDTITVNATAAEANATYQAQIIALRIGP